MEIMHFSLPLAFVLASSPLLAQNVQFSSELDQPTNLINWNVTSSAGTVNVSPSTFRLGGTLDFKLDSANAPFTSGSLNGALSFTQPAVLHGEVPNPFPFFPPLAEFDLKDLEFSLLAPTFIVDPVTGDFSAAVTLLATNGRIVTSGLLGSSNESVAGLMGAPTILSGNISQTNNIIRMWLDINLQIDIDDPASGLTSTVSFVGDVESYVLATNANSMHLDAPYGLIPGATSILAFSNATPSGAVFLAASHLGRGTFSIPSLGLTIGMHSPRHVATATSDAAGAGTFSLLAPASLSGVSVLFQCLQNGRVSNVAGTFFI
ncbi:MAG: hypothetical protein ACI84O_000234 [Myxococcota bacterium]